MADDNKQARLAKEEEQFNKSISGSLKYQEIISTVIGLSEAIEIFLNGKVLLKIFQESTFY